MIPIFKPTLEDEELKELKDTFDSHWIGLGPKTKIFEQKFCEYIGCKTAVSLNSCTAALHLCFLALGIKEDDEILIPAITFASTGHAVLLCNAKPILVDVNEEDMQIDIEDLKKKITSKTKAIIPVHYGGIICEMDKIMEIAKKNNLYVIEDAANACGGEYNGRKIGNLDSDFTCFSFEAKKNMTTGDGGMITSCKEGEIINKINRLKWVGMDKDTLKRFSNEEKPWEYDITELGLKYNMNDITASIGLVQLKKLDKMNEARIRLVKKYNEAFKDIKWIKTISQKEKRKNVYWLYILRLEGINRDEFMRYLYRNGVLCNTNFKPLHFLTFYKEYYERKKIQITCPIAEQEWKKLVVLPLYPSMTEEEQNQIIDVVKNFGKNKNESCEKIEGIKVISPKVFEDERGYFLESYNSREFKSLNLPFNFVQDNQSISKRGVLRGMHFQKSPFELGKLVKVVNGRILDVSIDLRKNSPTYKKWFSVELNPDNKKIVYIPEGFAHGFLALEDNTIVEYKFTNYYNKEADSGIRWSDPDINIDWQFEKYGLKKENLIISEKDRNLPFLKDHKS